MKDTYEHFMHGLNVDPYSNMKTILMNEGYYAQFKNMLYGDVTEASQPTSYGAFGQNAANGQNDEYVALR